MILHGQKFINKRIRGSSFFYILWTKKGRRKRKVEVFFEQNGHNSRMDRKWARAEVTAPNIALETSFQRAEKQQLFLDSWMSVRTVAVVCEKEWKMDFIWNNIARTASWKENSVFELAAWETIMLLLHIWLVELLSLAPCFHCARKQFSHKHCFPSEMGQKKQRKGKQGKKPFMSEYKHLSSPTIWGRTGVMGGQKREKKGEKRRKCLMRRPLSLFSASCQGHFHRIWPLSCLAWARVWTQMYLLRFIFLFNFPLRPLSSFQGGMTAAVIARFIFPTSIEGICFTFCYCCRFCFFATEHFAIKEVTRKALGSLESPIYVLCGS